MTDSKKPNLEGQLVVELRRMEALYRRAQTLIDSTLPQPEPAAADVSACLERLQPIMQQIQRQEATLGPLRQQWLSGPFRPGPELRSALSVHEQLLRALVGRIQLLEERLARARQELAPRVDDFVRRRQMQKAYQQLSQ